MTPHVQKAILETAQFSQWHKSIKSSGTRAIIDARIARLRVGLGDVRSVGEGVSELRIDHGPGFRVYFTETSKGAIVLLLVGGDKSSQSGDIKLAKRMLDDIKQKAKAQRSEL